MFCIMFQKLMYFSHPFYISMSSKAALSVLKTAVREAENVPIVFHMDCTFKCNLNEFPVLVFGVSDAQQQFHLLSMSVISHLSKEMYEDMLISFKRLITHVIPEISFNPEYGMTDCEVAERYLFYIYFTCYLLCFKIKNMF